MVAPLVRRLRAVVPEALTALLLALTATSAVRAQEIVVVRGDGPDRAGFRLDLVRDVELRVPDTAVALVSPYLFRVDSRGRYYFNDPFGSPGIRVFDRDGRFKRTVGRRGQAPGEFLRITALEFGPSDTMHVYGNAHWVFDSSGRHVRTVSTPELMMVMDAVGLSDTLDILAGSINTREAYGQPFHLVARSGTVHRSFGIAAQTSSVGAWAGLRVLTRDGRGGFLASKMNVYEIEHWTRAGDRQRIVRREADWFPAWSHWDSRPDRAPPPPRVMSMAVDDSGFVWTLISLADRAWRPVDGRDPEGKMLTVGELAERFDSIIEVLDPRTGRLLASKRFDEMLLALPRAGIAVENVESGDGEVFVRVWRVALTRPM